MYMYLLKWRIGRPSGPGVHAGRGGVPAGMAMHMGPGPTCQRGVFVGLWPPALGAPRAQAASHRRCRYRCDPSHREAQKCAFSSAVEDESSNTVSAVGGRGS